MLAGSAPVVRLKRKLLAACITCPLCHKLIREATTISECLHSFCRKCIFSKLTDEVADCCPICHIDLGCLPEVKLRPDHNLEDVRAKIFPYHKRKANGSETLPSISLPVRRNERSPSSLVVNTPQMVALASLRTKSIASKAPTLHEPGLVIVKSKLKECYNDDVTDPSSTEIVFKASHGTRQTSSDAETSNNKLGKVCRKCIFSKLTDEVADCCPICHIDLGCLPEVKLRPDHNLEDVRAKIFPYQKRKANGSETLPSISLPDRRNERSPSSLVVNTPQMVALASLRTKSVARKAPTLHGPGPVIVKSKLKECYNDDVTDSSSTETVFKASHGTRQTSSDAETSNSKLGKGTENNPERSKPELWRPQSCILGAASRTNGLMSEKTNCPNEAR